jgi:hypothetical protein
LGRDEEIPIEFEEVDGLNYVAPRAADERVGAGAAADAIVARAVVLIRGWNSPVGVSRLL